MHIVLAILFGKVREHELANKELLLLSSLQMQK